MTKIGLDSSVVLRLLVGEPEAQARGALRWLRDAKKAGIRPVVCDLVVAEVYFALQHHFGVSKAAALNHLSQFLSGGEVTPDGAAASVLAVPGLATAKPGFVDRLIHAHYAKGKEEGMATFERAAQSLPRVVLLGDAP
ncbi:MAG: PIN domain-containing protein [Kiritimatiellia bacterium]